MLAALRIARREAIRRLTAGWSTRKESTQPSEAGWGSLSRHPSVARSRSRSLARESQREAEGETTLLKELVLRALVAIQGIDARVRDEDGQTLAEYGLIMAVIAVAVVIAAVVAFRGAIVSAFNQATDCLDGSC